ncbi:MAG: DUF1127 domain-containing protein [Hyphomicrobiaceae bacterium]|jgi:uncharacterized protein YjiS (DUF1127 family)
MAQISTGYAAATAGSITGGNKALQLASKTIAWLAEQRRVRRTVATLSSLSDATLRDIGIERGNIERVARHGR